MILTDGTYFEVVGRVVGDVKHTKVGSKGYDKTQFAIARDKKSPLITCVAWYEEALIAAEHIRKGDRIKVCGIEKSHEYMGKTFTELDVQFFSVQPRLSNSSPVASDDANAFTNVSIEDCPF